MGLYAAMRVVGAVFYRDVNPALVIWSEHGAFVWRCWTAGYVGGMVAFVTWVVAGKAPERVSAVLARALPISIALIAAQGVLVP
jgi:hypothetical protein